MNLLLHIYIYSNIPNWNKVTNAPHIPYSFFRKFALSFQPVLLSMLGASFCNSGLYVENIPYVTTESFLFQIFNHTGKYSRCLSSCCICIRQKAAVVIAFHKQVCSCPAYGVPRITGNRAAVRVCRIAV